MTAPVPAKTGNVIHLSRQLGTGSSAMKTPHR